MDLPILPLVIVSGFLDGIHPCGIAVLLFFIAFLIYAKRSRMGILAVGMTYILGVFIAYFGIGLGIIGVVSLFPAHFMAQAGAALLILIGIIGIYEGISSKTILRMPKVFAPKIEKALGKASMPAALVGGILVGLCAFPCAGGIYVAIIGIVASQAAGVMEYAYLALYNLMFVMPLILILLVASNKKVLEKIEEMERKSRKKMRIALGLGMVALGMYIVISTLM